MPILSTLKKESNGEWASLADYLRRYFMEFAVAARRGTITGA